MNELVIIIEDEIDDMEAMLILQQIILSAKPPQTVEIEKQEVLFLHCLWNATEDDVRSKNEEAINHINNVKTFFESNKKQFLNVSYKGISLSMEKTCDYNAEECNNKIINGIDDWCNDNGYTLEYKKAILLDLVLNTNKVNAESGNIDIDKGRIQNYKHIENESAKALSVVLYKHFYNMGVGDACIPYTRYEESGISTKNWIKAVEKDHAFVGNVVLRKNILGLRGIDIKFQTRIHDALKC